MHSPDALSFVFLGCVVFAAAFLVISTVAGVGQGHGFHFGHLGHVGHVGHVGHIGHAGHVAHAAHAAAPGDAANGQANGGGAPGGPLDGLLGALEGALSVYGILAFLLVFGLLGYLLHNSANFGAVLTVALALVAGLVAASAISALLTRIFLANESLGLTGDSSRLEGRLGQVTMLIRPGGVGEVLFTGAAGSRQSLGARSADDAAIPAGTEVVILSYRDGIAIVQPWDRFTASARAGEAPRLEPIDPQP